MTDEEQLQQDMAAGRKIRDLMTQFQLDTDMASLLVMCAKYLVVNALKLGAETTEVTFGTMDYLDQSAGEWIVTARQGTTPEDADLLPRMKAAVVAQVQAADEWSAFYYIRGRAAQQEAIDAAWHRLRDANDELRAVATLIGKGGADA